MEIVKEQEDDVIPVGVGGPVMVVVLILAKQQNYTYLQFFSPAKGR